MFKRGLIAAVSAASLLSATTALAAPVDSASRLSVAGSVKRAAAPIKRVNKQMESSAWIGIGLFVVAVAAVAIVATNDDGDSDSV